jgi:hypothetical protein|tara:strand:- start:379 stop:861 length:483 start_codon:yes stop_codon:yes gene_type:complete
MGTKIHVAVPVETVSIGIRKGPAIELLIGKGHRHYIRARYQRSSKKRGLKRQQSVSVGRSTFGKEKDIGPTPQFLRDLSDDLQDPFSFLAIHKDGTDEDQPLADQRPFPHRIFAHEYRREETPQDESVEISQVVTDNDLASGSHGTRVSLKDNLYLQKKY